jgi:transcriptional regulator with XRE-family HTH domain
VDSSSSKEDCQDVAVILRQFGVRVRALRQKIGWSQEQLAHACQLDRSYIGGVERGQRNVSLVNIQKIAKALNVPLQTLFDFDRGVK